MGAAAVDVSRANALVTDETTDLDVLLDDQDQVLQSLVNGLTSLGLASHQSLNISRVLQHDDLGCFLDEINELVVLGNEVSLSVDFDDNTDLALGAVVSVDHTLGSNAACLLGSSSQTTLAQDLNSLLEVAVSLSQSLLALHHAAVGLLAQFHNVLCRNSHVHSSFLNLGVQTVSGGIGLIQPWRPLRQREHPAYPACLPAQRQP